MTEDVSVIDLQRTEPEIDTIAMGFGWGYVNHDMGRTNAQLSETLKTVTLITSNKTICKTHYSGFEDNIVCTNGVNPDHRMLKVNKYVYVPPAHKRIFTLQLRVA